MLDNKQINQKPDTPTHAFWLFSDACAVADMLCNHTLQIYSACSRDRYAPRVVNIELLRRRCNDKPLN
jgi:hypothetical protein